MRRLCTLRVDRSWAVVLLIAGCSSSSLPESGSLSATNATSTATPGPATATTEYPDEEVDVTIDVDASGLPIDRRLLGTNVPAWLGPDRLRSSWLRGGLSDAGITTIRMPGGSWSNGYGWSACELRTDEGCIWEGAARPSDYADLLAETGLMGVWTVSVNETAESAAALVAFFNGSTDDERIIGVDRNGVDWGTVSEWASIRAVGGHPEPIRIDLWEIGNEVYGGRPETGGDECAPFGWERVWTCSGTDYIRGDDAHDGYLEIRRAMREVDPTVAVGAVGVADPASWSNWGNEVIEEAGSSLDFYVVHWYGFDSSPSPSEAGFRAREVLPAIIARLRSSLGTRVPIALTEYNLVSFEAADTKRSMTTVVNALFIADSIGQLARHGVEMANHWNLANGTTASGTDYGLVEVDTGTRFPQFEAVAVWGRAGELLLPVEHGSVPDDVSIYATRRSDGSIDVILLHSAPQAREISVTFAGLGSRAAVTATSRGAAAPDATSFDPHEAAHIASADGTVTVLLPSWSITELDVVDVD